jgi:hypothetical protein
MKRALIACLLLFALPLQATEPNPYSALSPEQRSVLQPAIKRYISDQLKRNWADLWEIQDQTRELKAELLLDQQAPDMNRESFVIAMKQTMGLGFPLLKKFELQEVKPDKGNFLVVGCGTAVRENFHIHATTIFGVRIVDGKPKFDLFGFVSSTCS